MSRYKKLIKTSCCDVAEISHKSMIDNKILKPDNATLRSEGFPSGQRGQTVNLLAQPSKVRILLPPPTNVMLFLL